MHADICTRKCSHQRPDEMWKTLLELLPLRDSVTLDPAAEGCWSWREDLQTWSSPANIISMLRTIFPFQFRLQEVKIRISKAFWVRKWLFLTVMFFLNLYSLQRRHCWSSSHSPAWTASAVSIHNRMWQGKYRTHQPSSNRKYLHFVSCIS